MRCSGWRACTRARSGSIRRPDRGTSTWNSSRHAGEFDELRAIVREFVREREWERFHTPKNLATAISVEASELLEPFQWLASGEQGRTRRREAHRDPPRDGRCARLPRACSRTSSTSICIARCFEKMELNRAKYPVHRFAATRASIASTRTRACQPFDGVRHRPNRPLRPRPKPDATRDATQKESPMDFTLSPELTDLQARVRAFIADEIVPLERDPRCTPHGPDEALRARTDRRKARARGLLSSHVSPEFGGLGLGHREGDSSSRRPAIRRSVRSRSTSSRPTRATCTCSSDRRRRRRRSAGCARSPPARSARASA